MQSILIGTKWYIIRKPDYKVPQSLRMEEDSGFHFKD